MESEFIYELTHRANMDLEEILSYISLELSNPKAASDFIDKLQAVIEESCLFPKSGTLVDNEFLSNKNVRNKMVGNYIMYYLPDYEKKIIYVLRIIYGKRNVDEILSELNV